MDPQQANVRKLAQSLASTTGLVGTTAAPAAPSWQSTPSPTTTTGSQPVAQAAPAPVAKAPTITPTVQAAAYDPLGGMDVNKLKSTADYNAAINRYAGRTKGGLEAYRGQLNSKYDTERQLQEINNLRKQVASTEQSLSNLPANLKQRTSGRLMTAAQLARQQAAESEPLTTSLGNLSRSRDVSQQGLDSSNSFINDLLGTRNTDNSNLFSALTGGRDQSFKGDQFAEQQRQFNADLSFRKAQAAQQNKQASDAANLQKFIASLGQGGKSNAKVSGLEGSAGGVPEKGYVIENGKRIPASQASAYNQGFTQSTGEGLRQHYQTANDLYKKYGGNQNINYGDSGSALSGFFANPSAYLRSSGDALSKFLSGKY